MPKHPGQRGMAVSRGTRKKACPANEDDSLDLDDIRSKKFKLSNHMIDMFAKPLPDIIWQDLKAAQAVEVKNHSLDSTDAGLQAALNCNGSSKGKLAWMRWLQRILAYAALHPDSANWRVVESQAAVVESLLESQENVKHMVRASTASGAQTSPSVMDCRAIDWTVRLVVKLLDAEQTPKVHASMSSMYHRSLSTHRGAGNTRLNQRGARVMFLLALFAVPDLVALHKNSNSEGPQLARNVMVQSVQNAPSVHHSASGFSSDSAAPSQPIEQVSNIDDESAAAGSVHDVHKPHDTSGILHPAPHVGSSTEAVNDVDIVEDIPTSGKTLKRQRSPFGDDGVTGTWCSVEGTHTDSVDYCKFYQVYKAARRLSLLSASSESSVLNPVCSGADDTHTSGSSQLLQYFSENPRVVASPVAPMARSQAVQVPRQVQQAAVLQHPKPVPGMRSVGSMEQLLLQLDNFLDEGAAAHNAVCG